MGRLTVDKDALRASGAEAGVAARDVESAIAGDLVTALLRVERPLAGARSGDLIPGLVAAVAAVSADLSVALQGLGEGLQLAAERFDEVDITLASFQPDRARGPL